MVNRNKKLIINKWMPAILAMMFFCSIILYTQAAPVKEQEKVTSEPHPQQLANYEVEDGSRFALCRDFSAYVNRQIPFYYYLGLKPDPQFKKFKLPRLKEMKGVNTKEVIAVLKKAANARSKEYIDTVLYSASDKKRLEHTQRRDRNWQEAEATYLSDKSTFYSAYMDVNHSGKKNHVLITKVEYPLTKRNAAFENFL